MVFCTWTQFPKKKERGKNPIPPSILHTNTFHKRNKRERKKKTLKKDPKSTFLFAHKYTPQKGGKRKKEKRKKRKSNQHKPTDPKKRKNRKKEKEKEKGAKEKRK
jgi:hypothetical protein